MRNGKYAAPRKRRGNAKVLATVLALTLALGCVAGGTLAWLTATTGPITNTFTIGDINISLSDTTGTFKGNGTTVSTSETTYVPGQTITTKPTVTVEAGSEACFLFIHIEEKNNTFGTENKKVIEWTLDNPSTSGDSDGKTWYEVKGYTGYYCAILKKKPATDQNYALFTDNKLTVNADLTKSDIETMKTGGYPTITITAAAVQMDNIPDSNGNNQIGWMDAWALLPADFTGEHSGT